jgi:hypothetical protein
MNRQTFTNYFDKLTGNQLAQKQQRRLDQAVLPSATLPVKCFDNARLLHEEREAWLDAYQLALAEAEAELAAVESLRVVHQQAVYAIPAASARARLSTAVRPGPASGDHPKPLH